MEGTNPGSVLARQATHQATSPAPHTYLLLFRLAENQNRSFSYWWRYEKLDSLYQVSAFALQRTCRGVNTRRVTAGRQHTNHSMSLLSTNEKLPRDIFLQVHNAWLRTLWLEMFWCSGFFKWPYGYITRHSRGPELHSLARYYFSTNMGCRKLQICHPTLVMDWGLSCLPCRGPHIHKTHH